MSCRLIICQQPLYQCTISLISLCITTPIHSAIMPKCTLRVKGEALIQWRKYLTENNKPTTESGKYQYGFGVIAKGKAASNGMYVYIFVVIFASSIFAPPYSQRSSWQHGQLGVVTTVHKKQWISWSSMKCGSQPVGTTALTTKTNRVYSTLLSVLLPITNPPRKAHPPTRCISCTLVSWYLNPNPKP